MPQNRSNFFGEKVVKNAAKSIEFFFFRETVMKNVAKLIDFFSRKLLKTMSIFEDFFGNALVKKCQKSKFVLGEKLR